MSTRLPDQIRLAGLQGVITIAGAIVAFAVVDLFAALSAAFGGCVAVISTLFLAWRYIVGERRANLGAEWVLRLAYRTALERLVLAAGLLAVGLGVLKLAPIWLLAGFVVAQLAWLAAPVWIKTNR